MGKSGKKVKSDKINALRKQYDAFLEEDKKRKDRNEFILGRLEDIRFSNTVSVPIHEQKKQLMREYYTFPQRSNISKSECANHIQFKGDQSGLVSSYKENLEETLILKEISKKYILIPKLQSRFQSMSAFANSPLENITDTDWKNKYNILDDLKRNEKETTIDKDNQIGDLHKEDKNMLCTDVPLDTIYKENPLPDSDGQKEYERHKNEVYNEKIDQSEKKESLNIYLENQDIIPNNTEYTKNTIGNLKGSKSIVEPYATETKLHEEIYDSEERKKEGNLINSTSIKLHSNANEQEPITEIKENKDCLQENDQQNNLVSEIKEEINEPPSSAAQGENLNIYQHTNSYENFKLKEITKEKTQGEEDEINQELNNANIDITELTQKEEEERDIIMNDTEEYKADNDNFDNRELFNIVDDHETYTNTKEKYENNNVSNEHVMYATENEGHININNQINSEPEAYSAENENYTNEEYPYYDESHQEPYTSEINEHEESSQRYDPSYEQQYANNYEDPNMVQYQNQQYEMENTYEQQATNDIVYENQNHGDVNYEYGNPENIGASDQSQHENIYNYENEISDIQHYDSNVQQEYSVVQNEEYDHPQEYNESGLVENVLDADNGLTENVTGGVNDKIKTINNTEETSENALSDVTLS